MRIQEEMVKMLNEESWDDVKNNYPNAGSTAALKPFFVVFKNVCLFIVFIYGLTYLYLITYSYITNVCFFH